MENEELLQYVLHGREERNIEYKCPISWQDIEVKSKIVKTVLAMSNIRDGGVTVIGVEQDGEKFNAVGLDSQLLSTYKQDEISAYINEFADPFVELKVSQVTYDDKIFVVIQIMEFAELPIICKKDGKNNLRRGAIYTRPRRKIESAEVPSQVEMRGILDIASEKAIRAFKRKLLMSGVIVEEPEVESKQKFEDQLEGL